MHAEMRELEMQLEGLEELKTQLSGAWSGVHTANARSGRRAHHARGATGLPRSRLRRIMAQGLCRLLARGSPRPKAPSGVPPCVGTVRVDCIGEGFTDQNRVPPGANSTMSDQCSVNAKLLRDLTHKLGLSDQLLQPALEEVAHVRRESAARAAQVAQLEAALAREAQQRLTLAKLALNAHTHLQRAGLAAAALGSACEVTPVPEPLGAAARRVAAHVECGLGALATDLQLLLGGAPRGATAVEQLRLLAEEPSLSPPGRTARSHPQAQAQPAREFLCGHSWMPPHETSPFTPRGTARRSSPAILVSPRSPLLALRPSAGGVGTLLHGPARRALEQKQLQPEVSPLTEEGWPISVGTQWAQAGRLKTLPPDKSSRGAVPLVVRLPHPLRCSSSPPVHWPLGDASRSVSTLTKADAFGPAAAHRVDSSASLGVRSSASSRAQAEAEQFRPRNMGGMGAFSIHSPKMKAPPTLSSALDGQDHRRPNSVALAAQRPKPSWCAQLEQSDHADGPSRGVTPSLRSQDGSRYGVAAAPRDPMEWLAAKRVGRAW